MPFEIDKEHVFPGFQFGRSCLNLGQANLQVFKGFKYSKQCAGLVLRVNQYTGLIVAAGICVVIGNYEKSRTVVGLILDTRVENIRQKYLKYRIVY